MIEQKTRTTGAGWGMLVAVALAALLLAPSKAAWADAPAQRIAGITPTPTFTVTPTPQTPVPTPTPQASVADPAIAKRGEPSLALPGEEVTFVIEATNNGSAATTDVVVTDVIPDYLEILEVTTSQGTVTVEGQQVTVQVGTIGPSFVVEIVIRTRVAENAPVPLDVTNVAVLRSPGSEDRISPAATVVVPATYLPRTGRAPRAWPMLVAGLLTLSIALLLKARPARN